MAREYPTSFIGKNTLGESKSPHINSGGSRSRNLIKIIYNNIYNEINL